MTKRCVLSQIFFFIAVCTANLIAVSTVYAQNQSGFPNLNERYYLQSDANSPIPAIVLNLNSENPNENYSLNRNEIYEDGTLFQLTESYSLGLYGTANVPVVFVHPIKANGEVDKTKTLGFPVSVIKNESSNKSVGEYTEIKQVITDLYSDSSYYPLDKTGNVIRGSSNYQTESDILRAFFQKLDETSSRSNPKVYPGQKIADSSGADVTRQGGGSTPRLQRKNQPATPEPAVTSPPAQQETQSPATTDIEGNKPAVSGGLTVSLKKTIEVYGKETKSDDGTIKRDVVHEKITAGEKFVAINEVGYKRITGKGTKVVYRRFHKQKRNGQIELSDTGEPVVYLLPIDSLEYIDPVSDEIKDVQEKTVLYFPPSENVAASSYQTEKPTDPTSQPTRPLVEESLGTTAALSECKNQAFATELGASGENCRLVEVKDFQLVKSYLIQQLKGQSQYNSILMSSGVIAIDNSTKQCSKVDVAYEDYVDDSKAQAKINEYKKNMNEAYMNIVKALHQSSVRVRAAFNSVPQTSKYTYSCVRDQSTCRMSYDVFEPEKLPLVREATLYADDTGKSEQMKIYGPNDEKQYLVVFKRGGVDVRSLVVKDPSNRLMSTLGQGPLKQILSDIKSFNSNFKFHSLSEIQEQYNSESLKDSKKGYFIKHSTLGLNGMKIEQQARLGTPQALSLIGKIRNNKTFYKLECNFNALKRSVPLPKWGSTEQEAVQ